MIDHKEVSLDQLLADLEGEIARLEEMIRESEEELATLRSRNVA